MELPFIKMHGLGNDFIILDFRADIGIGITPILKSHDLVLLADRHLGIGCDQLIILKNAALQGTECIMEIYNADGSHAGACGNATRCVASLLGRESVRITVGDRVLECLRLPSEEFAVNMGSPRYNWQDIPLTHSVPDPLRIDFGYNLPPGTCVNMGNPHVVFFVPDVESIDLASLGAAIERHPLFIDRANVSFATIIDNQNIALRTWERGVGITLACGSAACAAVAAGHLLEVLEAHVAVHVQHGKLDIHITASGELIMSGPAIMVARGTIYMSEA